MAKVRRHPRVARREVEVVRRLAEPETFDTEGFITDVLRLLSNVLSGMILGYILCKHVNRYEE